MCFNVVRVLSLRLLLQKSEMTSAEKNRAMKAALNAETRKEKAALQDEVRQLELLLPKKGISAEEDMDRREKLSEVRDAVASIDDGTSSTVRSPFREVTASGDLKEMNGAASLKGSVTYSGAYVHTEQTSQFVREANMHMEQQDIQLESIERGVDTLKEIGSAMGEELERHDGVIDQIETKMDVVTKELQTNNMKLKGVLEQVRSSRKIFIDIILVCILLAVGLYLYNMFK